MRIASIASLIGLLSYTNAAGANSCGNVDVIGTYDRSGLNESEYGISAVGTFRVADETDESKQPMFNFTMVNCQKEADDFGKVNLECKVNKAVVWAQEGSPNTSNPNCSLDLDASSYTMKELQPGVLTGVETSTGCFNTMLTVDKNTKRVYLSFTRTKYADNYDKTRPGTCGSLPRTQVMMNCTSWARSRKKGTPARYCDFSGSSDK